MSRSNVATLPVPAQAQPAAVALADQSPLLAPAMFDSMWRLSEAMSRAKTVPDHLRGSPGDCLRVVELAYRCGQSPFSLADHAFITGGKLALDGQAMMALINASPKVEGNLDYAYEGDPLRPSERACVVSGRLRGEATPRTVRVTLAQGLADSKGAKARWTADGDQMLAYYGARKWGRRHAPEITMGLYTPDELRAGTEGGEAPPMVDVTPPAPAAGEGAAEPRGAAAPSYRLLSADGEVLGEYPSAGTFVRAYGQAKGDARDMAAFARANLAALRSVAEDATNGLRVRLENEIAAAEATMPGEGDADGDAGRPDDAGDATGRDGAGREPGEEG